MNSTNQEKTYYLIKDIITQTPNHTRIRNLLFSKYFVGSGYYNVTNHNSTLNNITNSTINNMTDPIQLINFPMIPLCKDVPDSYSSHIYCWVLIALFLLWCFLLLRLTCIIAKRRRTISNEYESNKPDNGIELGDTKVLSRMLRQ